MSRLKRTCRLCLEPLENRALLSVSGLGDWLDGHSLRLESTPPLQAALASLPSLGFRGPAVGSDSHGSGGEILMAASLPTPGIGEEIPQ
jgi:hypothetical protein